MADCFDDCKLRKYTYGPPTDFRQRSIGPQGWHTATFTPTAQQLADAQAKIDSLPTEVGNCEKGCECVEDDYQALPYPKKSKPITQYGVLPGPVVFSYTKEFTTYTGQCDKGSPLMTRQMLALVAQRPAKSKASRKG